MKNTIKISVSLLLGMAMAVLCVLITTTALLAFNRFIGKRKGA